MARKKMNIGDLIKSDMSRRVIGEEPQPTEKEELFSVELAKEKKPSESKPPATKSTTPVEKPPTLANPVVPALPKPTVPKANTDLMAIISEQAQSAGLIDVNDLRNFYDFLQSQALRYIRGFDAGRRFHG